MHFNGQGLDALAEVPDEFRQMRILLHQFRQLGGLPRSECLALLAGQGKSFSMFCIRVGMDLVPIRLTGLCKQELRGGIGGLGAERKIEKNEGIDIELGDADHI